MRLIEYNQHTAFGLADHGEFAFQHRSGRIVGACCVRPGHSQDNQLAHLGFREHTCNDAIASEMLVRIDLQAPGLLDDVHRFLVKKPIDRVVGGQAFSGMLGVGCRYFTEPRLEALGHPDGTILNHLSVSAIARSYR